MRPLIVPQKRQELTPLVGLVVIVRARAVEWGGGDTLAVALVAFYPPRYVARTLAVALVSYLQQHLSLNFHAVLVSYSPAAKL